MLEYIRMVLHLRDILIVNACEISLTVNLDGDEEWPIWIETPDGKEVRVSLKPGDAMIYLGCTARHWREEYKG